MNLQLRIYSSYFFYILTFFHRVIYFSKSYGKRYLGAVDRMFSLEYTSIIIIHMNKISIIIFYNFMHMNTPMEADLNPRKTNNKI